MSCSLKSSKDMLLDFGIITKYHEIVNKNELQLFEENLMESVGQDVFDKAMGNPFFIQNFPDKSKLQFNKSFFNILDNLNDAKVFKSRILNETFEPIQSVVDIINEVQEEIETSDEETAAEKTDELAEVIEDLSVEEVQAQSIFSQEINNEMNEVYAKIDAMIESNKITITCKI